MATRKGEQVAIYSVVQIVGGVAAGVVAQSGCHVLASVLRQVRLASLGWSCQVCGKRVARARQVSCWQVARGTVGVPIGAQLLVLTCTRWMWQAAHLTEAHCLAASLTSARWNLFAVGRIGSRMCILVGK